MKLNPSQLAAIQATGDSIISAGAGSGKTQVLVERCLDRLLTEDPSKHVSLDQILILTFMEDAAAEMKKRIRRQLTEELEKLNKELEELNKAQESQQQKPNDSKPWEQKIISLETEIGNLEEADISTIHSFCTRLLKENYYLLKDVLNGPPRILDEPSALKVKEEAFQTILQKHYVQGIQDEIVYFLREFLDQDEQALKDSVFTIYDYTQTLAQPTQWLQEQKEKKADIWDKFFIGTEDKQGEFILFIKQNASHLFNKKKKGDEPEQFNNLWHNGNPSVEERKKLADFLLQCAEKKGCLGKDTKGYSLGGKNGKITFLIELYKQSQNSWEDSQKAVKLLIQLTEEFDKEFTKQKRLINGVTFSDQLHYTHRLLQDPQTGKPTPLALTLQTRYKLIFVDEFQDTDGIQNAIIESISNHNRFLVGDARQSIYRFRAADPEIFRNYISPQSGREREFTLHALNENYRSHPQIIHFINALFERLMQPEMGGIHFRKEDYLIPMYGTEKDSSFEKNPSRIQFFWNISEKEEDLDNLEKEAILTANCLLKMKAANTQIKGKDKNGNIIIRSMKWSDVTILCRGSIVDTAAVFMRHFERNNIPVIAPGISLFDCIEVKDVLNLIRILNNPQQDYALMGVLCSPIVGITPEELISVRVRHRGISLWEAISQTKKEKSTTRLHKELRTFVQNLERWRTRLRLLPLSQLLEEILSETAYEVALSNTPFPEQKVKNIRRLLEMVENFDPLRRQGIHRFLDYVEAMQNSGNAEDNQSAGINTDTNAVQIKTIHKSKGLEFPIVFLVGTARKFLLSKIKNGIIYNKEYGLETYSYSLQEGVPHHDKTLGTWIISRKEERESRGEELRLLYVALTRACDYLFLCGSVSSEKIKKITSRATLDESISSANCYADWLIPWIREQDSNFFDAISSNDNIHRKISLATRPDTSFNVELHFSVTENYTASSSDIAAKETSQPVEETVNTSHDIGTILDSIRPKTTRVYPYTQVVTIPGKASVSSLKRESEDYSQFERILRGKKNSQLLSEAAERGTAYHHVMEMLEMQPAFADTPPELAFYIEQITAIQSSDFRRETILPEKIKAFWETKEAKEFLRRWDKVRRELPFTIMLRAEDLHRANISTMLEGTQESIIVQGVVDLIMLDPETKEIWLLDYKTDKHPNPEEHRPQIELYALSLETIYKGYTVTHRYLAYLETGTIVELQMNDKTN